MRFRGKVTAASALVVSAGAVVGGMLVTSSAMAATPATTKGTVTIVSMTAGDDQPVTCTYDDIDLPAPGTGGEAHRVKEGTVEAGTGEDGPTFTTGEPEPGTPTFVQGRATAGTLSGGVGTGDGPVTASFGPGSSGARQGTADECAALKETIPAP